MFGITHAYLTIIVLALNHSRHWLGHIFWLHGLLQSLAILCLHGHGILPVCSPVRSSAPARGRLSAKNCSGPGTTLGRAQMIFPPSSTSAWPMDLGKPTIASINVAWSEARYAISLIRAEEILPHRKLRKGGSDTLVHCTQQSGTSPSFSNPALMRLWSDIRSATLQCWETRLSATSLKDDDPRLSCQFQVAHEHSSGLIMAQSGESKADSRTATCSAANIFPTCPINTTQPSSFKFVIAISGGVSIVLVRF